MVWRANELRNGASEVQREGLRAITWILAGAAWFALGPQAVASDMRFLRGELVAPADAITAYGSSTTHTDSLGEYEEFDGRDPELVEQARALGDDPDQIFEYVHNHIRVEFAYGLRKGALGTLIDRSGTPFDQNVLFVELVREAGFSARYRLGTATLTAAQFEEWTGISNVTAACRLLANGGIPAAFNGASSTASDCSGLSSFTSVSFRHIWSEVQIGGTWYVFDPSFKSHDFAAQRDLASDSSFSSGAAVSAAASGLSTGTQSGVSYIADINNDGLDAYLTARSTELLEELENSAASSDMRDVVGGGEIIAVYDPDNNIFRRTTPLYTATGDASPITGDIPNQYRTAFNVDVDAFDDFSVDLFVDDISGRRLEFDSNFYSDNIDSPGDYFDVELRLELDDVRLGRVYDDCGTETWSSGCQLPGITFQFEIEIDHPYLADGGDYADETYVNSASGQASVAIVHSYGRTSSDLGARWGRERNADRSLPNRVAGGYNCDPEWTCQPQHEVPAGDMARQRLAASWLAQYSRMAELNGEIGASEIETHHNIGAFYWTYNLATYDPDEINGPVDFGIADQQLVTVVNSSVSVTSRTNDAARVRAVSRAFALTAATLEGSVVEQQQDLPDAASTAARLAWGNDPDDEDPCSGSPRRFYDFTGASSSTISGLITFEGSSGGCNTTPLIPTGMRYGSLYGLDDLVSQGFQVSGAGESFLGPGARIGAVYEPYNCSTGAFCSPATYYPSLQRGGAIIATDFDGSGDVERVLHNGGSGGGSQPEHAIQYDPSRAADVLKDRFIDRSSALGVNLNSGSVGFTTPVLLSVGAGDGAPYRLDYSLSFQNGFNGCSPQFGPCTGALQGGWTNNWDIHFSLSGSGLEAMGSTSPLAATDTIIAIMAMQDTFAQTGTANMRRDLYAALIADWWRRRLIGNVATVNRAFQGQQYIRQSDDTWLAPIGAPGELTQTGERTKVRDFCLPGGQWTPYSLPSTSRRWDASAVNFSLRNAGGDVMEFEHWDDTYSIDGCSVLYGFAISTWTWPQGPSLTFSTFDGSVSAITSSLGRTLSVNAPGMSDASISTRTAGSNYNATAILDSSGAEWTFDFTPPVARSATDRPRPYAQLEFVFEPVSDTEAALAYEYDHLGRVMLARDAVAIQETRDDYEFFIAEGVRGQRLDPAGYRYTVYYDTNGNAVRHIDELGREITSEYDGRHRVIQRTYPEGDYDTFDYDALDNVVELIRYPRPDARPILDEITISATYNSTWNRLASLTDGRGNTTNFTYYASGNGASLIETAVRPAVGGSSPTYTFAYNSTGLVTSETDPTGRVTTHTYNSYGDRTSTTIGTATVGSQSALNLATTFTPDSWGDIVTVVDPRSNATTTEYDAMRRPTIVRRHNGGSSAALLAAERTNYDALGRVTSVEGGTAFSGTSITTWLTREARTYTPTGQVATVTTDPGTGTHINATTTNTYDELDQLLTVTDPVGRITRNEYDAARQLTRIIRAYGTSIQQDYARYTYSPDGMRASVRDANDNRSVFVYDGFNRLCRLYFPSTTLGANTADTGGITESALTCESAGSGPDFEGYGYDANGNRTSLRLRSTETINFTYDVLNRLTVKDIPGGASDDVYSSYDLAGRRTSVRFTSTSGSGLVMGDYDAAGRLLSETAFGQTLAYQYDGTSNRTRLTWPDTNYVQYDYDAMNRVSYIRENNASSGAGVLAAYTYDALSRRGSITRGNSTVTTFAYDTASRLTELVQNLSGTADDQDLDFLYTAASQISQRTAANDNYNYVPSIDSISYVANGLNQYATVDSVGYSYDDRGNLINDGSRRFCFDLENRLTGVAPVSTNPCSTPSTLALAYDPMGRLRQTVAGSTTTRFVYDGDNLSLEFNGSDALLRRYVFGPGVDEPIVWYEGSGLTDRRYLITDHQGSIIAENGSSTTRYLYGPFGEPVSWSGSRFRYTGQAALPEAQLYHYKARVYDPVLGRFLQTDPVGYEDDQNLYAYVASDPVNGSDPTGQFGLIGGAIGVIVGAAVETGVQLYNNGGNVRALDGGRIAVAAAVGGVTGATGGLAGGAAGAVITAARGAQVATSLGGRIAVGVATGSVGGAAGEATRQGLNNEPLDGGRIVTAAGTGAVAGAVGGTVANRVESGLQGAGFRRATTADVAAPNRPGVYTSTGTGPPSVATTTANVAQTTVLSATRSIANQAASPEEERR